MEFAVALGSVLTAVVGLTLFATVSWLVKSNLRGKARLPPVKSGWIPWVGCAIPFGKEPLWFIQQTRKEVRYCKGVGRCFLAGGVWGGLGLTYPSQAKPDTG